LAPQSSTTVCINPSAEQRTVFSTIAAQPVTMGGQIQSRHEAESPILAQLLPCGQATGAVCLLPSALQLTTALPSQLDEPGTHTSGAHAPLSQY
jgi:hypothetical protein